MTQGGSCQQEECGRFLCGTKQRGVGRCGGAGSHCCNDDTLDGLVHWNENTSRLDRCKSGAAVGVVATGAAEEMKDGPESPIE